MQRIPPVLKKVVSVLCGDVEMSATTTPLITTPVPVASPSDTLRTVPLLRELKRIGFVVVQEKGEQGAQDETEDPNELPDLDKAQVAGMLDEIKRRNLLPTGVTGKKKTTSGIIIRRLWVKSQLFLHELTLDAISKYNSGTTVEPQGFLLDSTTRKAEGYEVVKNMFYSPLSKHLSSNITDEAIFYHSRKAHGRNTLRPYAFTSQISRRGRAWLTCVYIHTLELTGTITHLTEMIDQKAPATDVFMSIATSIDGKISAEKFDGETPKRLSHWFRGEINTRVISLIFVLASLVVENKLKDSPESDIIDVKPSWTSSQYRILRKEAMVDEKDCAKYLIGGRDRVHLILGSYFLSLVLHILVTHTALTAHEAYECEIDGNIQSCLLKILRGFLGIVSSCPTDCELQDISFEQHTIIVMHYFLKHKKTLCITPHPRSIALNPTEPKVGPYGNAVHVRSYPRHPSEAEVQDLLRAQSKQAQNPEIIDEIVPVTRAGKKRKTPSTGVDAGLADETQDIGEGDTRRKSKIMKLSSKGNVQSDTAPEPDLVSIHLPLKPPATGNAAYERMMTRSKTRANNTVHGNWGIEKPTQKSARGKKKSTEKTRSSLSTLSSQNALPTDDLPPPSPDSPTPLPAAAPPSPDSPTPLPAAPSPPHEFSSPLHPPKDTEQASGTKSLAVNTPKQSLISHITPPQSTPPSRLPRLREALKSISLADELNNASTLPAAASETIKTNATSNSTASEKSKANPSPEKKKNQSKNDAPATDEGEDVVVVHTKMGPIEKGLERLTPYERATLNVEPRPPTDEEIREYDVKKEQSIEERANRPGDDGIDNEIEIVHPCPVEQQSNIEENGEDGEKQDDEEAKYGQHINIWAATDEELNSDEISLEDMQRHALQEFGLRPKYVKKLQPFYKRTPTTSVWKSRERSVIPSKHIPISIEGHNIEDDLIIDTFLDRWCIDGVFDQKKRATAETWLRTQVEMTLPRYYLDLQRASYNSFNEYHRLWIVVCVYVIYSELADLCSRVLNWEEDYEYPDDVTKEDERTFEITSEHNILDEGKSRWIVMHKRVDLGTGRDICCVYDVVAIDKLFNVLGQMDYSYTAIGIVHSIGFQKNKGEAYEVMSVTIQVYGISKSIQRLPNVSGIKSFFVMRNLGFIGSSVRAFESVVNMMKRRISQEARDLLIAKDVVETVDLTEGIVEAKKKDLTTYAVEIAKCLWNLKGHASDYLRRMTNNTRTFHDLHSLNPPTINDIQAASIAQIITTLPLLHKRSFKERCFALVGPAGTGKTNTLIHVIGAIMNTEPYRSDLIKAEKERRRAAQYCEKEDSEELSKFAKREMMSEFTATCQDISKKGVLFVICPTNTACDVIERKLQAGLDVKDVEGTWENVICPYRRVSPGNANPDTDLELRRKYASLFPGMKRVDNPGLVVLTTFGSLHRIYEEKEDKHPVIRAVFVEEASLVPDSEICMIFDHASRKGLDNLIFVFVGDPMQNNPVVKGRRTCVSKLYEVSLMERLICRMSPSGIRGENAIVSCFLNMQYRMNPVISKLSNRLAQRNVNDAECTEGRDILPVGRVKVNRLRYESSNIPPNHTFSTRDLSFNIVLLNPYTFPDGTRVYNEDEYFEESIIEANAIASVIRSLNAHENYQDSQVTICSTYSKQLRLLRRVIGETLKDLTEDNQPERKVKFCTVAGIQGSESGIVIYSAVKSPREVRLGIGLVGDLRPLYVLVTRAISHLIIVGDMEFLMRSPHWRTVRDYVHECETGSGNRLRDQRYSEGRYNTRSIQNEKTYSRRNYYTGSSSRHPDR